MIKGHKICSEMAMSCNNNSKAVTCWLEATNMLQKRKLYTKDELYAIFLHGNNSTTTLKSFI